MSTTDNTEDLGAALAAAIDAVDSGNPAPAAAPVEHEDAQQNTTMDAGQPGTGAAAPAAEDVTGAPEGEQPAAPGEDVKPDDGQPDPDAAPVDGADESDTTAAGASETERAPSTWRPEVAAKWGELPAEVRAEIARREADYHKGYQELKANADIGRDLQQVIAPHMQTIQAAGVHPLEAVDVLLRAEHTLRYGSPDQKAQALAKIGRDYGIDLAQAAQLPPPDPHVEALRRQNEQLMRAQQTQQQQQQRAVQTEIETFRANPANVHFEAVKGEMAALLNSGTATSLQDAYDKAVWMRPDIRQTLVQQQRTAAEKQSADQARRQRAKTAAGSVKGSAPSKTAATQHPDLRSAIEAALDGDS